MQTWFKEWFNTTYYHQLYFKRDDKEAADFIDKLITHLKPAHGSLMLDVACGKGRHSIQLSGKGFDVTGIDLSEDSIMEALKNENEELLERTPDDMHRRIAREFARIEKKYPNPMSEELIFSLLQDFKYIIPQGSPMAGIGNHRQIASLSNCFVIGSNQFRHVNCYNLILHLQNIVMKCNRLLNSKKI